MNKNKFRTSFRFDFKSRNELFELLHQFNLSASYTLSFRDENVRGVLGSFDVVLDVYSVKPLLLSWYEISQEFAVYVKSYNYCPVSASYSNIC
jgi:hypothetical protein